MVFIQAVHETRCSKWVTQLQTIAEANNSSLLFSLLSESIIHPTKRTDTIDPQSCSAMFTAAFCRANQISTTRIFVFFFPTVLDKNKYEIIYYYTTQLLSLIRRLPFTFYTSERNVKDFNVVRDIYFTFKEGVFSVKASNYKLKVCFQTFCFFCLVLLTLREKKTRCDVRVSL